MMEYWWVYLKDVRPGTAKVREKRRREQYREINGKFPQFTDKHFSNMFDAIDYKKQINNHFPDIPLEVLPGTDI